MVMLDARPLTGERFIPITDHRSPFTPFPMLRSLSIRDFVIVDRLELEFAPGFTVLTGETGAGKSILIDALAMVLGERAEAIVVRGGAERAEISAEFESDGSKAGGKELARWLAENDLAGDDGALLMRRVIEAAGRSRGFINGHAATLAQLREAGEFLVDIHGQHEHQSLLRARRRSASCSTPTAGLSDAARNVAELHRAWQQRRESRMAFETNAAAFAAEREQLEWQVRELGALKFSAGRMAGADGRAHAARARGEPDRGGAAWRRGAVGRRQLQPRAIERGHRQARRPARVSIPAEGNPRRCSSRRESSCRKRRTRCATTASGSSSTRSGCARSEQRLDAIHGAARKYRVQPEALPAKLETAKSAAARSWARAATWRRCASWRKRRTRRAWPRRRSSRAGAKRRRKNCRTRSPRRCRRWRWPGGTFEVALNAAPEVAAHGLESVEFLVSAHKGMAPQPLAKVASGGELSRLSLAMQTVASQVAQVPTLIFDEVDAGIGGRVAEIVGKMLKQLGRKHQVMCITHLPQVAATADQQWQVTKSTANGKVLAQGDGAGPGPAGGGDRAHAGRGQDHRDHAQARGGDAGRKT